MIFLFSEDFTDDCTGSVATVTKQLAIQRGLGGNISVQLTVEHAIAFQTYSISYLIEGFFGNVTATHIVVADPTIGERGG